MKIYYPLCQTYSPVVVWKSISKRYDEAISPNAANIGQLTPWNGLCVERRKICIKLGNLKSTKHWFVWNVVVHSKNYVLHIGGQDQLKCKNGNCIDSNTTCDGFNDCGDFSDDGRECGKFFPEWHLVLIHYSIIPFIHSNTLPCSEDSNDCVELAVL